MRIRIAAVAVVLLVCQISLFAQNMPRMPIPKAGKLVPGDTLSIRFLVPSGDNLGSLLPLTLTVGVLDDGTITAWVLDKVPAAGLSIMELNTTLQQRYTAALSNLPFRFSTSAPPQVTVGYLGHLGGTSLDKLIDRIGKSSTGR
jgi:protein involved in polysaccharide export with SLBB domain